MNRDMNMKLNLAVIISCLVAALSTGVNLKADQDHSNIDFVETKIVDGFLIGVTDEFGQTNSNPDRRLCFSIWTTNEVTPTQRVRVIFPNQPENAYQVELFDTNGIPVPKTETGKKVGTKFFDFNTISFLIRATGPGGYSGPGGESGVKAQGAGVTKRAWEPRGQMLLIFRPSDLFDIEKPGRYTLRIRFQIIVFPRTGPQGTHYKTELIRFPPLDYPLMQPNTISRKPQKTPL